MLDGSHDQGDVTVFTDVTEQNRWIASGGNPKSTSGLWVLALSTVIEMMMRTDGGLMF